MDLKRTVPWGRDYREYREMFSLDSISSGSSILGCGDGPASFNFQGSNQGFKITSVDPIYLFDKAALEARIKEARGIVMPQIRENLSDYVWSSFANPEELEARRLSAMQLFLDDYDQGRASGRYLNGSLPVLPFDDNAFNYALCSHFLFLYSPQFDEAFHIKSILELCRVARQVRVYPLLSIESNERSPHLTAVFGALDDAGLKYTEMPVSYEFQKGANAMLVIESND